MSGPAHGGIAVRACLIPGPPIGNVMLSGHGSGIRTLASGLAARRMGRSPVQLRQGFYDLVDVTVALRPAGPRSAGLGGDRRNIRCPEGQNGAFLQNRKRGALQNVPWMIENRASCSSDVERLFVESGRLPHDLLHWRL